MSPKNSPRSNRALGLARSALTPPVAVDPRSADASWILHWMLWVALAVAVVFVSLSILIVPASTSRWVSQLGQFVTLFTLLLWLNHRGHTRAASMIYVVGTWSLLTYASWFAGGVSAPAIAVQLVAVATVAVFFGWRWGLVATGAAVGIVFLLAVAQVSGLMGDPVTVHTPISRAVVITEYLLVLGLLLSLLMSVYQRSKRRLELEVEQHARAESEIRRLNLELEVRVQERTSELEATVCDLEEATRAKNAFLASMSHELRTPLNSIIGFAGILEQGLAGELTQEQTRQAGMIGTSGRRLLELVNEVLDLSKIEDGAIELANEVFDATQVASRVCEMVRPMAESKGLAIACVDLPRVLPMRGDPMRAEQVLLNLVGNAVKYTHAGDVTVSVALVSGVVRISVRDTGAGIPRDEQERVFQRFYQVTPEVGGKHEGTGLGLSLSRELATLMGGAIELESEPGKGSTFTLALPQGDAT